MAKIIAIIGATGTQGFSVVRTLLESAAARQSWKIRAIVRNPQSKAAQGLQSEGVEVVKADLDDLDSIKAAFASSSAVFAVTDFFVPFAENGANASEAIELETKRVHNIADAVSATTSVEHFIWSTLPHAGRITGGKIHPAHFVAKNQLDDRIKSDASLLSKTTFLAGKHIQLGPIGPDVPIPSVGDPRTNIGPFVLAILQQPERTLNGRFVLAVTEQGSMNKFLAAWSQVTGKSSQFVQCAMEDYERLWPGWGKVEGDMLRFYNEFGGQVAGSEKEILMASDLDVDLTRSMGVVDSMRRAIEKS